MPNSSKVAKNVNDQCDFPRCRNLASMVYLSREICDQCWLGLCSADTKKEKRLLKKIYLTRQGDGKVVPINEAQKEN